MHTQKIRAPRVHTCASARKNEHDTMYMHKYTRTHARMHARTSLHTTDRSPAPCARADVQAITRTHVQTRSHTHNNAYAQKRTRTNTKMHKDAHTRTHKKVYVIRRSPVPQASLQSMAQLSSLSESAQGASCQTVRRSSSSLSHPPARTDQSISVWLQRKGIAGFSSNSPSPPPACMNQKSKHIAQRKEKHLPFNVPARVNFVDHTDSTYMVMLSPQRGVRARRQVDRASASQCTRR